jgi:hypothetical protein
MPDPRQNRGNLYNMTYSPLAIKRRQVLGDLYSICDGIDKVPIILEGENNETIGYADESLGKYADAFLFHVPEEVCKKLATGHYLYSFEHEWADPDSTGPRRRIVLNSIHLTGRKVLAPVSRSAKKAARLEGTAS